MKCRLNLCLVVSVVFILGVGYAATQIPLIKATRDGDTEKVRVLLAEGADVNATDNAGDTVLIVAAWGGHTNIVQALLAKGALTLADQTTERKYSYEKDRLRSTFLYTRIHRGTVSK